MANTQNATAHEAGRPQPQTTVEPAGPFIRNSQAGRAPIYNVTGGAFGGTVTQPLVARPGYFRNFRVTHTFTSTGTVSGSITLNADAPYNLNSLIQVKDAFGTPLLVGDGYSISNLVNLYGGSFGLNNGNNVATNLPSYGAIGASGNGTFSYSLPLEFSKAYGVLSAANASLLPTLQFNYNTATNVLGSTATGNYPTIGTQVDTDFYWLPEGTAGVEPPGLGTTRQWQVVQANPQISSGASARVQFPRLGGYLDTVVAIVRDSTGARTDQAWPSRLQWYVDGVPLVDTTMPELYDDMAIQYGLGTAVSLSRPTGTIAFCRKTSLNQQSLGLLDTGEVFLSTNPATLLELNFSPAGTISNSPATLSCLVGQIVPTGALITGLPEL
jgi:hypothetical protein